MVLLAQRMLYVVMQLADVLKLNSGSTHFSSMF